MTTSETGKSIVETQLQHFGVKGMHWGIRRSQAVTVTPHVDTGLVKRQTKVVTKGGQSQPAHPDAVKAAVQQQKLKKSGHAALSNQELRDLITRKQLEDQATQATTRKGRKVAQKQLETAGQQHLQRKLSSVAKKAAKGAAAAA